MKKNGIDTEDIKQLLRGNPKPEVIKKIDAIINSQFKNEDIKRKASEKQEDKTVEGDLALVKMVIALQMKLIQSLIHGSDKDKINMYTDILLYGRTFDQEENAVIGLRTPNYQQHLLYTCSPEVETICRDMIGNLTEKLMDILLVDVPQTAKVKDQSKDKAFPKNLNNLFKATGNDRTLLRKTTSSDLTRAIQRRSYNTDDIKDFIEYILNVSNEEYNVYKRITEEVHKAKLKRTIKQAYKVAISYRDGQNSIRSPQNSISWMIEEFFLSTPIVLQESNSDDKELEEIIPKINNYLQNKYGRSLEIYHTKEERSITVDEDGNVTDTIKTIKSVISKDQQIAAQIALAYLSGLSDVQICDLAQELGALTREDRAKLEEQYSDIKPKKRGAYAAGSVRTIMSSYNEAMQNGK